MEKIFIKELRLPVLIGVNYDERASKQDIIIDLEANTDAKKPAQTDDINDALDYAAMSRSIGDYLKNTEYYLIETLAENLANYLLQMFSLKWLRLGISKTPDDLPNVAAVGVVIEREL